MDQEIVVEYKTWFGMACFILACMLKVKMMVRRRCIITHLNISWSLSYSPKKWEPNEEMHGLGLMWK